MKRIAVETTSVIVLAESQGGSGAPQRRGAVFEEFVSLLLAKLGYEDPKTENLRVTSEGIEIDLEARARVNRQRLVAECKAYSANVAAPHLTSFLGKFALQREDDAQVSGLFVALPRLTPQGLEKAKEAESKFTLFRYLGSAEICELLEDAGLLPNADGGPELASDLTVVITPHGLALAAKELDADTRRAQRLVVWSKISPIPEPMLRLIEGSALAEGLSVSADEAEAVALSPADNPPVVLVRGSSSDFEYQLPAAPKFFVGRKEVSERLGREVIERRRPGTVVVNARSGWGKSSLALRLGKHVEQAGGFAMVVDSRTAETPHFVQSALEKFARSASDRSYLDLDESSAAFTSVASCLRTLDDAAVLKPAPLLLFFDQFENVFRDEALTREFRDLAALVADVSLPLTIGFAWKTDLVGWTEGHPYRFRDEIRQGADLVALEPLGPREIETLLRRLERALDEKLDLDLRRRLREYSQGLPWLFKKLAGHIISEVERGATQEELVRESLNVQTLFESDLSELNPNEQEALRFIARSAPALVSDLEDAVPTAVLQGLLNRRLIVQVGDRVDTYWDIFRDFLLTGTVAIQDSYIIRYGPASVGRLMRPLMAAGGELSVPAASHELSTSSNAVFNLARELRLMGLVSTEANTIRVQSSILDSDDPEGVCRAIVGKALRRHKISGLVASELNGDGRALTFGDVAGSLPRAFPTVEANSASWLTYARAFCQWLAYAELVEISSRGLVGKPTEAGEDPLEFQLLSGRPAVKIRSFPQAPAGPSEDLLRHLGDPARPAPTENRLRKALIDLTALEAIESKPGDRIVLLVPSLAPAGNIDKAVLRELIENRPGCVEAFKRLESNPAASATEVGELLREAYGAEWQVETTKLAGKNVRSWARLCGIRTSRSRSTSRSGQGQLSDLGDPGPVAVETSRPRSSS